MDNIRSGNLSVKKMKEEINKDLALLELGYIHKRAQRQIMDGDKFLEMISKSPYSSCKTVSKLKKKISEERESLKQKIVELDCFMPGHQFSIFEQTYEKSDEEKKEIESFVQKLKEETHWLHKCLGMCSNRNYFK